MAESKQARKYVECTDIEALPLNRLLKDLSIFFKVGASKDERKIIFLKAIVILPEGQKNRQIWETDTLGLQQWEFKLPEGGSFIGFRFVELA